MRRLIVAFLGLFISACNLSSTPATPTSASTPELPEQVTTAAPSLTPLPGIAPTTGTTAGATRTPFGNNLAPTTQSIATNSAFPTPATAERAEISAITLDGTTLYISGIAHNLPENKFTLEVFAADNQPITSAQMITLSNPNHVANVPWSASVMVRSGYTGMAQIRISARLANNTDGVIATASVNIVPGTPASAVQPAGGAFTGSIRSPENGTSVSANPVSVTGTSGGIPDNTFTLLLLDGSGTIINSQVITLTGAETNAVPWSALLGTSGYRGRAEIRAVAVSAGQQITIASVTVTLQ